MSDAVETIRAIDAISSSDLVDQMEVILGRVGNLLNEHDRKSAYFRVRPDFVNIPLNQLNAADREALSRVLPIRLAGHQ